MKKFILLLICCCLTASIFAEFAPSLGFGVKINNPSTGIEMYTNSGNSYNLIEWGGLESTPSFAIDFDFEWYLDDNPIYFGIATELDLGLMSSGKTGFKLGYYNDYINLFCKVGASSFIATMDTTKDVYWSRWSGDSYSKIDSFTFYDVGVNFGLGLDIHPSKGPFFIRLSYDHEIYNPDLEIKTLKFTDYIGTSDIYGDTDFHNRSFTIAVGWQFRRKNIVKEVVPIKEDVPKDKPGEVREASFKYVDVPTLTYNDLFSMIRDALFEKGNFPKNK
jgi:hypothetical protein